MANYIKGILKMDYDTLLDLTRKENFSQFKSVLNQMAKTANRRINELNKSDIGKYSPALKSLNNAGIQKFNLKDIEKATSSDTGKLLHEYATLKRFLSAKSSTVRGWNKIRGKVATRTGATKMFGTSYKSKRSATYWHNREKRFWDIYNKLVDEYGGILTQLDSNKIQAMLNRIQSIKSIKKSDDKIREVMEKYVTDLYEHVNAGGKASDFNDDAFEEEIRLSYV